MPNGVFEAGRSRLVYSNLYEISPFQRRIMQFVDIWAREKKRPIAQKEIIGHMKEEGIPEPTTVLALKTLLLKGYIRRAVIISNKTFYVQLRRV